MKLPTEQQPKKTNADRLREHVAFRAAHAAIVNARSAELSNLLCESGSLDKMNDGAAIGTVSKDAAAMHIEIQISRSALDGVIKAIPDMANEVFTEAGVLHGKCERIGKAILEKVVAEVTEERRPHHAPHALPGVVYSSKKYLDAFLAVEKSRVIFPNIESHWADGKAVLRTPEIHANGIPAIHYAVTASLAALETLALENGIDPNALPGEAPASVSPVMEKRHFKLTPGFEHPIAEHMLDMLRRKKRTLNLECVKSGVQIEIESKFEQLNKGDTVEVNWHEDASDELVSRMFATSYFRVIGELPKAMGAGALQAIWSI
jgi:hypothetical protein